MQQHEGGRGVESWRRYVPGRELWALYPDYVRTRQMRLYLRAVLNCCRNAVIAGDYPAAMYAESKQYLTWRPVAMDIFFFDTPGRVLTT